MIPVQLTCIGSCTCSKFQTFAETCFKESCAQSHLKEGLDAISVTCANYTTTITSSQPSTITPTSSSSSSSVHSTISGKLISTDGTFTQTTLTSFGGGPAATQNTALPPGWPSSIIGPACVPMHNLPNGSYPAHSNWTNGIIYVNGTWMNSSCVSNLSATGVEQVSVNGGSRVWMSMASLFFCGFVAFVFL
jgi:hypothetical protein